MTTGKHINPDSSARLAALASRLMALVTATAVQNSSANDVSRVDALHDELGLFPRLTISMPHGGQDVHLVLTLNDQKNDRVIARLLEIEAHAEEMPCH